MEPRRPVSSIRLAVQLWTQADERGAVPFGRECCQYCCHGGGQRLRVIDNCGISAQRTDRDGRSWTMCPCLRIRRSCPYHATMLGRRAPGLRSTSVPNACPRDVPEPPSTANDRRQQQPVNLKLAQAFGATSNAREPLVMRKSPPSASSGSCTRRALPCSEPRSPRGRHGHSVFPAQA
jgi:hypothetical protein